MRIRQNQKAWKFIRDIAGASSQNLNRIAIRDGVNIYTYGLMFRQWERYASVFSALGMTKENHARVGLMGSGASEVVFAVYGLNMVGAQVSLVSSFSAFRPDRVMRTIQDENLTDFIVVDDLAQPNLIADLLEHKEQLGLRNVILLHATVGGPSVGKAMAAAHEAKYRYLQSWFGPICMDALLLAYGNHPVSYAPDESDNTAFIIHTSGTTSGTGKPIALSDKAFNVADACFFKLQGYDMLPWDDPVSGVVVDLSNAYGIIDQVHLPLAMGGTLGIVPAGALNPNFYKSIPEFGLTLLFCVGAMFEHWIKMPESTKFDFSSLRCVIIGGAAVSASDKRRYYEFMQKHGGNDVAIINGYGISELGGACCLSSTDLDDESIGYLLPGVEMRLYDDDKQKFLSQKDLPCEGVLYLTSGSAASPTLDEKPTIKVEMVGRKPYVCTNDLVRVDADGKITYLGRANRYFVNDDGIKYESGRVETEVARQSGIESCGVVPVYYKWVHDNIPMLCVKTLEGGEHAPDVVRKALLEVFKVQKTLELHNIPYRVMIVDELPRNANGKVDLYAINQGKVSGTTYEVKTKKVADLIADIRLIPLKEEESDMIKDALSAIAEDVKGGLPFANKEGKEDTIMNQSFNPIAGFNALNQMGAQAMGMLFNACQPNQGQAQADQAGQASQPQGFPFPGMQMPGMQFPNFQMPNFQMPGVQLPNFQSFCGMGQGMDQMMSCMNQMNQTALQMVQQMYEQNCQLTNQMFQILQQNMGQQADADASEPAEPAE
ncbi:MAG: AMP-binding protein [Coriobacteriales bacterium]|nr:AMP-binding protein [Coriobacteriales bacterium]